MAWTAPTTRATGDLITASNWNTDLVENLKAVSRAYDLSTSELDLVSSAAETNIYTKAVAAGDMSTNRTLRCTIIGDYLNNSGSARTLLLGIYMLTGGTPLWKDVTGTSIAASATRREWRIVFEIANLNSASVQKLAGEFTITAPTAGSGGGIGDIDGNALVAPFGGAATQDTASAWTLYFTAQHGASDANLSFRKKYALLEIL